MISSFVRALNGYMMSLIKPYINTRLFFVSKTLVIFGWVPNNLSPCVRSPISLRIFISHAMWNRQSKVSINNMEWIRYFLNKLSQTWQLLYYFGSITIEWNMFISDTGFIIQILNIRSEVVGRWANFIDVWRSRSFDVINSNLIESFLIFHYTFLEYNYSRYNTYVPYLWPRV